MRPYTEVAQGMVHCRSSMITVAMKYRKAAHCTNGNMAGCNLLTLFESARGLREHMYSEAVYVLYSGCEALRNWRRIVLLLV